MSEQDEVWSETERETLDHLQHRVNRFLSTLVQQYSHYDNILVVSHGLWIEACLRGHCPEALPNGERVHNCDLFGGDCVSHQGSFVRLQNIRRIP
jgi:broad specificity phosphatase PhoE